MRNKVISFEVASETFTKLKLKGKRLVQCHGTFDLLHPGHFCHLEEASRMGDILVVTVTGSRHVNKGPGRPFFNDQLRASSLAALECVDYVVVVPFPAAVEAIECVRPDIYCKGVEYSQPENDVTGNIQDDVTTVEKHSGKVAYIGSIVFSSSKLINNNFQHIPEGVKSFCRSLAGSCSPTRFRDALDSLQDLKVLLIGDIIFDRYSYVRIQGLTSKASIVSARYVSEELQTGGTLAVYRHLKQFTPHVKMISLAGVEDWTQKQLDQHLSEEDDGIVRSPDFTTIVKHRYVSPTTASDELVKYFSVNYIDNDEPTSELTDRILESIEKQINAVDLVIVADFGHGVLQKAVRELLQAKAPFLALNCQTNSNNHGFNVINRQYRRTDCFSLDQTEILLAAGRRKIDYRTELETLKTELSAEYAWLTRGSVETLGLKSGEEACGCPPLERDIRDSVGAGDAFFALAALAAKKGFSNALATFAGQLAGAQAVRIVGNTEPVSKSRIVRAGMSLLTF